MLRETDSAEVTSLKLILRFWRARAGPCVRQSRQLLCSQYKKRPYMHNTPSVAVSSLATGA